MGLLFTTKSSADQSTSTDIRDNRVQGSDGVTAGKGATVTVQSDRALQLAENAVSGVLAAAAQKDRGELAAIGDTFLTKSLPAIALVAGLYLIMRGRK